MPYLRFFNHQRPCLLRAFFRPPVAGTPLRFADPSPPSGWVKDFHLQVSVHTPHTLQPPFRRQNRLESRFAGRIARPTLAKGSTYIIWMTKFEWHWAEACPTWDQQYTKSFSYIKWHWAKACITKHESFCVLQRFFFLPQHCCTTRTGRIANPPQDFILPHCGAGHLGQAFWKAEG
jgi:hypothetical protein